MGQQIVYCFKCQKRILGTEITKGLAYQVENQMCCSTCVVLVLETLPPKAKEALLAKMFKANQERQSGSTQSLKALGEVSPGSSTRKIPTTTGTLSERPAAEESSSTPLIVGVGVAVAALVLVALALSGGSSSPAPATVNTVKRPPSPLPPPPPDPGLSPQEQRRAESAKNAMKKARDFVQASPKDLEGQAREWRSTLLEAAQTGYETEARRELEKAESRVQEAAAKELTELDRQVRELLGRKEFKASQDLLDQARGRRSSPEWSSLVERLQTSIRDALARSFNEVKEKALSARDRGAKAEIAAAKAEVARWGFPQYVTELEDSLKLAWRPLFDGKTAASFLTTSVTEYWKVIDGALVHDQNYKPRQAGQNKEDLGDGEFRFRFSIQGVTQFHLSVRQGGAGAARAVFTRPEAEALGSAEHELIFTCRGSEVTATLDGQDRKLQIDGKVAPKGRLQFGSPDGALRISAVDYRPIP